MIEVVSILAGLIVAFVAGRKYERLDHAAKMRGQS